MEVDISLAMGAVISTKMEREGVICELGIMKTEKDIENMTIAQYMEAIFANKGARVDGINVLQGVSFIDNDEEDIPPEVLPCQLPLKELDLINLLSPALLLNVLAELRDDTYENTRIYKEQTKKWHDSRLRGDKDFKVGDKVLLYNSRLNMYPRKLKSKWSGPNIVKRVYPYGATEIIDQNAFNFKVNGQQLNKYYEGNIDKEDDEVIEFENGVT
ncbi:hypothetical protein Tco_0927156 [Tanacetum coccineum]